jgi:tetratricopeptide (TPR) repeat protein
VAINKNKVTAAAQKLMQRGAYDKAIKEYQKLVEEDPKDVRTLLKIGDLFSKKGDQSSAVKTYERVAQTYSEQGFYSKAVAVYKQILKVDPALVDINRKLAEIYQQLGLLSDAMTQYQNLAGFYERQGRVKETVAVFKRMVELDPENVATRVKLAELYSRESQNAEAVAEFEKACEQLDRQSRTDDYVKVAERLLFLDASKLDHARHLARIYLDRRDTKRALGKLQACFKADPRHIETLHLLADAFRDLNQIPKTVSVLKELAKIHDEHGARQDRDEVWRTVLKYAPDDPDARKALGNTSRAEPVPNLNPLPGQLVGGPPIDPTEKVLAEIDFCVSYGMLQKAKEHLDRLFRLAPDHPIGLERLRQVSERTGDTKGAIWAVLRLAEQSRDNPARYRELCEQARRIDSTDARVLAMMGPPIVAAPAPRPPPPAIRDEPPSGGEVIIVEDEEAEETVFGLPPNVEPAPAAPPPPAAMVAPYEVDVEADEYGVDTVEPEVLEEEVEAEEIEPEMIEPEEIEPEMIELEEVSPAPPKSNAIPEENVLFVAEEVRPGPALPSLHELNLDEEGTEAYDFSSGSAEATLVASPIRSARGAPEAEPAPWMRAPPGEPRARTDADVESELEEAEFFLQQGLLEEARVILVELARARPARADIAALLKDVEARIGPREATSPGRDGAEAVALEEMFEDLSTSVGLAPRAEDCETHYDLGIAYKEMGLIDDAIYEFSLAMRSPARELSSIERIGSCLLEKRLYEQAILEFKRGLVSPRLTEAAAVDFYFGMGSAYEGLGDEREALYYYRRVSAAAPSYRDVQQRILRLAGGAARPSGEEEDAAPLRRPG